MLLPVLIITRGVRYVYSVHFSFISKSPRLIFGLKTAVVYFGYTKQVKNDSNGTDKYNNVK